MPTPELYVRWAQLGLFSSHSRCHGAGNDAYREPWRFGEEAERIFKKYAELRYSLIRYIYGQAEKSVKTGLPMMRALWLMHPDDRNTRYIEDQYYFGDSLMVAPVLKPLSVTQKRSLYLPAGTWYDYWTKEKIQSRGQWIKRDVDLETMPLYVKAGTTLVFSEIRQHLSEGLPEISHEETFE